ncbi:MAG TPA: TetR/AcrR family transcriptional regulator [Terracidiphilus sp.]|jgi:AcrR family transcriptional regulator
MRKGQQTRERIIAQAAPIFNTRGFAGSSMQDVMEATGLEKGGLYRHFSSKEELAAETFRYALAGSVRLRTEKLDGARGALEQLRLLVKRFVEAPSAVKGGCPLMNTAIDADDGNARLRALARKGFADWRERLCGVVREGLNSGEIQKGTEPRRIANTIIATLEGALTLSRLEGTRAALEDAQASLELLIDLLRRNGQKTG